MSLQPLAGRPTMLRKQVADQGIPPHEHARVKQLMHQKHRERGKHELGNDVLRITVCSFSMFVLLCCLFVYVASCLHFCIRCCVCLDLWAVAFLFFCILHCCLCVCVFCLCALVALGCQAFAFLPFCFCCLRACFFPWMPGVAKLSHLAFLHCCKFACLFVCLLWLP